MQGKVPPEDTGALWECGGQELNCVWRQHQDGPSRHQLRGGSLQSSQLRGRELPNPGAKPKRLRPLGTWSLGYAPSWFPHLVPTPGSHTWFTGCVRALVNHQASSHMELWALGNVSPQGTFIALRPLPAPMYLFLIFSPLLFN